MELTKDQAKSQIELIIDAWIQKNQEEWNDYMVALEYERRNQANEYASTKNKSIRLGLLLPPTLMDRLEKSFPQLFKEKEQFRWFLKEFKAFTVANKE